MAHHYVHGYSAREETRLLDQAGALATLLHEGVRYPDGARVLEAGCGVGAQTAILLTNSPGARFVALDRRMKSAAAARRRVGATAAGRLAFVAADLLRPPFAPASFDHVFVCFVLEHLPDPAAMLAAAREMLVSGGTITVIEGDHGSAFFHPRCRESERAISALMEVQRRAGGDPEIGRTLHPLLRRAGFESVHVVPRVVYADPSRPEMVRGFTLDTFAAMIEGARDAVLGAGLMTPEEWGRGVAGLRRAAGAEGTFSYTFFRGTGVRA